MADLIIELQNDIFENKDILLILRKAYSISKELDLKEFNEWINNELNGYQNTDIPEYRRIITELRCNTQQFGYGNINNIPIFGLDNDLYKSLTEFVIPNSIPDLLSLCDENDNSVLFYLDKETEFLLINYLKSNSKEFHEQNVITNVYRFCPINQIESIIEYVKNKLLSWISELKNNQIYGKDYIFTNEEKESAKNINFITINSLNINNTLVEINLFKKNITNNLNSIRDVLSEHIIEYETNNQILDNIEDMGKELKKDKFDLTKMEKIGEKIYNLINEISISIVVDLLKPHILSILLAIVNYKG